jgi:ligand-binding sensor domain-containing protein
VTRYDGERFVAFTTAEGMAANVVTAILEDRGGNLWFGTAGGGVSRYDGKQFTTFTTREGLVSDRVKCIFEDRAGWWRVNKKKGRKGVRRIERT